MNQHVTSHPLTRLIALTLVLVLLIHLIPLGTLAAETDEVMPVPERSETKEEALQSAQVQFEEVGLRSQDSKHFRLDDGSYVAIGYDTPVHYLDSSGQWVEYDNTLVPAQTVTGEAVYRVQNGDDLRIFAADAVSNTLLAVQHGDYGLALALPHALIEAPLTPITPNEEAPVLPASILSYAAPSPEPPTNNLLAQTQPEKLYSALEYAGAFTGTTLRYENYANTIKESIIIHAPQSDYSYTFELQTDDLTPALQNDGSITFTSADGVVIYTIPAPYLFDNNNAYSYDAYYTLESTGSAWLLTVTANADWINASDRAFPVTLDPTIESTVTGTTQMCAGFIRSGYPSTADTSDTAVYVGNDGGSNQNTESYFHIKEKIPLPTNCVITYAGVALYHYAQTYQANATDLNVGLYRITKAGALTGQNTAAEWNAWANALTWNQVYSAETTTCDTITIDSEILSSSTTNGYVYWDFTDLAIDWYEDDWANNLGFALKPIGTASSRATLFGPEKSSNRPKVVLQYRNMVGVESAYSSQAFSIGRAGTSYVNDYTLNNTLVVPIIASDSNVMPFSLSLVYNSAYKENSFTSNDAKGIHTNTYTSLGLGAGWKLSAQQTVVAADITGNHLIYTDADGTEHYFQYNSSTGTYLDEDGLGLSISGSSSVYTMSDLYGNTWTFTNGYLTQQSDAYGNKLYYYYSGNQISSIVRANTGASATETLARFGYSNGRLISITNENSRATTLSYSTVDSVTCLTGIQYPDGVSASYNYYSSTTKYGEYCLHTAYDNEAQYGIEFSYGYGDTVRNIYEYHTAPTETNYGTKMHVAKRNNDLTTYRYYGGDRLVNTADDILVNHIFDAEGRTVGSYSTDATETRVLATGSAVYTKTNGTSRQNNRVTASAGGGQLGTNLLTNPSAEHGTTDWTNATVDASTALYGNQSFKLTNATMHRSLTCSAGSSYTFSAYVKVPAGATAQLMVLSDDATYQSEMVNYATTSVANGWKRLSVTFTAASAEPYQLSVIAGGTGTVYVDALQFEQGATASSYNLLEDGSFEALSGTISSATGSYYLNNKHAWYQLDNSVTLDTSTGTLFGTNAVVMAGADRSHIMQQVDLNLPGTTSFIVSGWGKGDPDPDSLFEKVYNEDMYFGIYARIFYDGSTTSTEEHFVPFCPTNGAWQYSEGIIVPEEPNRTITGILVAFA